uniref:Lipoxygenase n=1 Tax=Oryza nivara TaxID=4536 RepID=A0A0E0IE94_ORYNI
MLRPQLNPSSHTTTTSSSSSTQLFASSSCIASLRRPSSSSSSVAAARRTRGQGSSRVVVVCASSSATASRGDSSSDMAAAAAVRVKAVATIKVTVGELINRSIDIRDLIGRSLSLELVSSELDAKTGKEKATVRSYAHNVDDDDHSVVTYEADFDVPSGFGPIGAIIVTNELRQEMFLEDINLTASDGAGNSTVLPIRCNSWVQPKSVGDEGTPSKRIFFANKKRGDGTGEREADDRVYDYDVYNDLGNPDSNGDLARPVLGGNKQFPYPRRCRTGRPPSKKDPKSETRKGNVYVPRDEEFSPEKEDYFLRKTVGSVLQAAVPAAQSLLLDKLKWNLPFPSFFVIDKLFEDGVELPGVDKLNFLESVVPRLLEHLRDTPAEKILRFETPANIQSRHRIKPNSFTSIAIDSAAFQVSNGVCCVLTAEDKFAWLRDEEFARETLAGINPYAIELVREFPLKSKLDPAVYGPAESAITADLLEEQMRRVMTVEEAISQKRLFMLDFHDLFLPYVHKIRSLDHTTMYGSRTVFFLTDDGTLQLLAIELTRPASPSQPQWRQVFTPSTDATMSWLWRMAKAHVRAHDAGHHELITHWLRTHCAVEPYIIAANRQLSEMHPIYQLLRPHFRYTMRINARARSALISAGGIIERSFSPQKYSMELSSVAYDKLWRFDTEALPADLVRRGMAEEDPTAEHGLKLAIEDYPFANDGLLIWDAIKTWVQAYVARFYPDAASVAGDEELQAFWTEVRTKGHGDKKDEPWWPKLDTPESLAHTLTTIIWVAAAHHAAVNFGQYDFGGYFPNRPSIPSQVQATVVMAVLDVLSSHSTDEEYLGGEQTRPWNSDAAVQAAYDGFAARLKEIEGVIDGRNKDRKLKNRCGAGILPYQLMKPFSDSGVTGMGIPNSTSI